MATDMSLIEINIKEEYLKLVPRPNRDQYQALKNAIIEDGQQMNIIVNQDGVILDGHTRYQILKDLKIQPKYETRKFKDEHDEINFVIITNLTRRNLNLFQRGELLHTWWQAERLKSKHEGGMNMWKSRRGIAYVKKPKERLAKQMGKILGCGHTTFHKIMRLIDDAPQGTLEKLREDRTTITTAYMKTFKCSYKTTKEYGYEKYRQRNKICLSCGEKTKPVIKEECHVHDHCCCQKCEWGL